MSDAKHTARAILTALTDAQSVGETPHAISLAPSTWESLQAGGFGYGAAGPATLSLFNVPVVIGREAQWRLHLDPEVANRALSDGQAA